MENLPFGSIYEAFDELAKRDPDKTALIYLGKKYSYSEIKDLVERLAANLYQSGIKRGDKAIIYLVNCPQWVIAWLALLRIGAVAVPITPIYTPSDLKYIANDSGAETAFCMDTNFGYVIQVLAETSLKRIIVSNAAELLPWWKRVIGKTFDKVPEGNITLGKRIFAFKSFLKGSSPSPPPFQPESKEIAEIVYTGGTLGFPKGIPISNILFMESINVQRMHSESLIPRGKDIVMQGGALFHMLGQGMGLGAILQGDTAILPPRVNLDGVLDCIQRYKAKSFFAVPTLYRMILEHDRLDYYDLKSLEYCFTGGDVLPLEINDRWLKRFKKPLYQGYGTTETCGGVSTTPAGESFPEGAAGKVQPNKKVKLVDPDTLGAIPYDAPGELLVSSNNMVTGYWNKPEETAECFVHSDDRLWYKTGDIVRIDKDGWLFFLDRSADMIKYKGYRVAASKVETVLQEHPAVIASCVVGIPDPAVGERIKAFVVLKEDVRGVSVYDLMRWCRERLAPYEVPQYIESRDMLPKSKVGKLLRREMREGMRIGR